jgi:membrane-bound lytic murein transglycosylase B
MWQSRTIHGCAKALALALAVIALGTAANARPATDFRTFIESLWPDAKAAGVSRKTFDTAFAGVEPDYSIPDLDLPGRPKVDNTGQAEFLKTAAD